MVQTLPPHTVTCASVGLLSLMLWAFPGQAFEETTERQVVVAAVIDTKGQSTTVSDLQANYYRAGSDSPGPMPGTVYRNPGSDQTAAELRIDLELQEGRTTWHEPIRVPMADLRQLSMESRRTAPFPPERVLLQRRDGSTILLSKTDGNVQYFDTFEERDPLAETKRKLAPESGQIRVRATLGQDDYRLIGFEGSAIVSTGAKGKFSIQFSEVQGIEFK